MSFRRCILWLSIFTAVVLPAWAADVDIYANATAWQNHSANLKQVNLDALTPANSYVCMANALTADGVTFTSGSFEYVVGPQWNPKYTAWNNGGHALLQVNWGALSMALPTATSASFTLNSLELGENNAMTFGGSFVVALIGQNTVIEAFVVKTTSLPDATFVGFTSKRPFDTVVITPLNHLSITLVSSVQYGQLKEQAGQP